MDEPRKRGRPARGGEAAARRSIRATDGEWGAWLDEAASKGIDVSEWVRQACAEKLARDNG